MRKKGIEAPPFNIMRPGHNNSRGTHTSNKGQQEAGTRKTFKIIHHITSSITLTGYLLNSCLSLFS